MDRNKLTRSPKSPANSPRGVAVAAIIWMAVLFAPTLAAAQIYTFIDDDGVTHFTNQPHQPVYNRMVEVERDAPPAPRPPDGWQWEGLIGISARQQGLPPALVKAVIAAESDFDPEAVSRAGAQGLMQLMPQTAASLGVSDPLRPEENVRGGSRYLAAMIERYGDLSRALAAYNAGPAAVDRYGGVPPYRETRDYVKRVLTYYRDYHGDFGR